MTSKNSLRTIHKRSKMGIFLSTLLITAIFSFSCRTPAPAPPPAPPQPEAPPPAEPDSPEIEFNARPSSIDRGESTMLGWQTRNADSVRIEPNLGAVEPSGRVSVMPSSSVTYTATATGPGGSATDTVRVTVIVPEPPPAPPPIPSTPEPTIEELFRTNIQPVLFDYDKAEIRSDQVGQLQANVRFLQQNRVIQFTVSGHADERGSQEYNIGLGDLRANAVREFLLDQGVEESRIQTVSFGEERPICNTATEDCFQRNRRAAFVIRGQ